MLIAQFGHFWEMAAEEWLDPESTDADRAHAERRVAELDEPPLRVDALCFDSSLGRVRSRCRGAVRTCRVARPSDRAGQRRVRLALDVGGAVVRRPVEQLPEVALQQRVGLLAP